MDLMKSIAIAASGLRAQAGRMRIISENLANADSASPSSTADPFRRKIATFRAEMDRSIAARVVALGRVRNDPAEFRIKHEPGHPAADASGNVKYPNIHPLIEMSDMREAQRSYEANINVIGATRRMIQRTLDILRV
jgi:flagellar basal-body rod protein FlgC